MTISVQTPRSGPYSGDGLTVAFSYTFLIDVESELVVVVADAAGTETVKTLTTDYTVSGVGNNSGGTVTFVTAPASTETISIRRSTAKDQGVDLQNRGSVVPQVIEDTFDEVLKMIQDVQEQVDRAILLKLTANVTGINVPTPSADRVLGWNSAGTDLENKTPNTGTFVTLPGASTDTAVVRFDGTTGGAFQNSAVLIDDSGNITGVVALTIGGALSGVTDLTLGGTLLNTAATPVLRLDDSDVSGTFDVQQNGATGTLSIDPGNVDASSAFTIEVDAAGVFYIDGAGVNLNAGTDPGADINLKVTGTGAMLPPSGTTAQRPATPAASQLRYNSTLGALEAYFNSGWNSLLGTPDYASFAAGDVLYVDASGDLKRLAKGSDGDHFVLASGLPSWATVTTLAWTEETMVASTSGTAIDFTSLPAGTKRIQVCFDNVSQDGTSNGWLVQLGDSGGIETTGYWSGSMHSAGDIYSTAGFIMVNTVAAANASGIMTLTLMDAATNLWVSSHGIRQGSTLSGAGGGSKALSAELTQLRVTTVGGTNFDNGNINVICEG